MSQFMQIETKELVRVMSDEGNFLVLNNGMKIDKQLFSQKYAAIPSANNSNNNMSSSSAEEFLNTRTNIQMNPQKQNQSIVNEGVINTSAMPVDPIDFLNSTRIDTTGVESLQKIDTSTYLELPESDRQSVKDLSQSNGYHAPQNMASEERALREKYNLNPNKEVPVYVDENDENALNRMMNGMQQPQKQVLLNENGLTEAQEMMRQQQLELNGIDPYEERIKKYRSSKGYNTQPVQNPRMEQPIKQIENVPYQPQMSTIEDPTTSLFKKLKRNHNMTITFKVKDKISKPDFIKVMADGLEGDIIQYYADEIFKRFLSDIQGIKSEIYNQIHKEVYGCLPEELDVDDEEEIKTVPKKVVKKTEVIVNNVKQVEEDVIILTPGKPTKDGKRTFKYVNEKGKVVDMLPELADEKGFKPAVVSKLTEGKERTNVKPASTTKKPKIAPAPQKPIKK